MSAATSRRPKEPAAVDTPARPASAAPAVIFAPGRLGEVRAHLSEAADAIDGWYARQATVGHTCVDDGHDAVRLIDAATRDLYRVRAALVGEIRADEAERAAWVDRMIAVFQARWADDLPGDSAAAPDGGVA